MASSLSSIAAKDGAAATVAGGILAVDKSGAGTGPFFAAQTIVDTQGVNTATVKAASTAPVATDTAVVVAISPNSVNANILAVAGGTVAAQTAGAPVVGIDQYGQYETVAASQTAQAMGASGATGDYLAGVLVFPGTAGCGVVTVLDNAVTIGTFPGGGTTALPSLVPFMIPIGLFSVSGAWKITTGANVTAVGIGRFT